MTNLPKGFVVLLIILIIFLLGALIGLASRPFSPIHLEFDEKINLVQALGVISTFLIAWLVAKTFEKHKQTEQNAKTLISTRIEEAYELILQLSSRSNAPDLALVEINSTIKRVKMIISHSENNLTDCNYSVGDELRTGITDSLDRLGEMMTNTPIDQVNLKSAPVKIKDNIISYSAERQFQISAQFDTVRGKITLYQLAIYKA